MFLLGQINVKVVFFLKTLPFCKLTMVYYSKSHHKYHDPTVGNVAKPRFNCVNHGLASKHRFRFYVKHKHC